MDEEPIVEEPVRQVAVAPSEPEISGPEDDADDIALEAYMQNMMRRVRGDSSAENEMTHQAEPEHQPVAISETAVEPVSSDLNRETEPETVDEEPFRLESIETIVKQARHE